MSPNSEKAGNLPGLRAVADQVAEQGQHHDDPARSYQQGDVIGGKYRLGAPLGQGGMGQLWLAHNQTLDIDVAVKLIRANVDSPDNADRLLQEARAAAKLGHPAIVRIFDFGTTRRGDPFIAMELLAGEDLHTSLTARGRLSAAKAVRMLLPIAHALKEAHGKGIVHRDLKPENIFLQDTDEGGLQPKLVDFGVAKLEREGGRLTQTGALVGSPMYMSPEQARGDDVDHRADIWAFCVLLYEAVTGRPPFEGKNYNAILYAIVANQPPPSTLLGAGDEALWAIIARGLEKDPDRRWQSMQELGVALSRWLVGRGVSEDITGASVDATWLSRRSSQDLSIELPSDWRDVSVASAGGSATRRARFVTTRNARRRKRARTNRSALTIVAIIVFALSVVTLGFWITRPTPIRPAESYPVIEPHVPPPVEVRRTPAMKEARAQGDSDNEAPIPVEALEVAPPVKLRAPVPVFSADQVLESEPKSPVEPTRTRLPRRSELKDPFQ